MVRCKGAKIPFQSKTSCPGHGAALAPAPQGFRLSQGSDGNAEQTAPAGAPLSPLLVGLWTLIWRKAALLLEGN